MAKTTSSSALLKEWFELYAAIAPGRTPPAVTYDRQSFTLPPMGRNRGFLGGTVSKDYFEHYFVSPMRKYVQETHEWYRPGNIDEVCRRCGDICSETRRICPTL